MKYNVGDKVRIKPKNHFCSVDGFNNIHMKDEFFNEYSRLSYCETIMTIGIVNKDFYILKEDRWAYKWTDEMIEGLVEEETKTKFKVGDRIITNKGYIGTFEGWVSDYQVRVLFPESGCNVVIHPKNLKLAEDESNIDLTVKGEEVKERIEITIPEGYEYVIESSKIIFTKKKKEVTYPKTYEECLKVLGYEDIATHCIFHNEADEKLFNTLYDLKVCRDAYWKIAGEEMGLNGPWEPDWNNEKQNKYGFHNEVKYTIINSAMFVFPTEEMRDAFKKNFDADIEICKEFL